jgi:hypothetical protein
MGLMWGMWFDVTAGLAAALSGLRGLKGMGSLIGRLNNGYWIMFEGGLGLGLVSG